MLPRGNFTDGAVVGSERLNSRLASDVGKVSPYVLSTGLRSSVVPKLDTLSSAPMSSFHIIIQSLEQHVTQTC